MSVTVANVVLFLLVSGQNFSILTETAGITGIENTNILIKVKEQNI